MRLALKHQIVLAPAAVLCIMVLLVGFLQYTYWNLSVQRERSQQVKTAFISLVDADYAAQRMHALARLMLWAPEFEPGQVEKLSELHRYLEHAVETLRIIKLVDSKLIENLA